MSGDEITYKRPDTILPKKNEKMIIIKLEYILEHGNISEIYVELLTYFLKQFHQIAPWPSIIPWPYTKRLLMLLNEIKFTPLFVQILFGAMILPSIWIVVKKLFQDHYDL